MDSGNVVKVITIEKGKYSGLKESDIAKLDEIKKATIQKGLDENLTHVIRETTHYTVSEYIKKNPNITALTEKDYKVGGYDVLNILVYEEEDLSREAVRVSADGYISFPLIGRVKINNLTTSEIERLISKELAEEQYLLDAHISVMVKEYNSKRFLVLGSVRSPGSYSLQAKERVLDAISKAGGILRAREIVGNHPGAGKKGMIIRTLNQNTAKPNKIVINLDLQDLLQGKDTVSNIFMIDKDVLYIPTAELFYIIGEIKNPGSYAISDKEITLIEAISMAGGFTPIAARNRTRIIRVEDGVEKILEVKVDAITNAGKKIQDVPILPNDVIVIPQSFF